MRKSIIGAVIAMLASAASATVPSEVSSSGPYACNGTTVAFTVGFKFYSNTDLAVVRTPTTGAATTLTYLSDYTVTGAGTSGGTVTLVAGTKCPADNTLTINRLVPYTQLYDPSTTGYYNPALTGRALDRQTMMAQQLKRSYTELKTEVDDLVAQGTIDTTSLWSAINATTSWSAPIGDGSTTLRFVSSQPTGSCTPGQTAISSTAVAGGTGVWLCLANNSWGFINTGTPNAPAPIFSPLGGAYTIPTTSTTMDVALDQTTYPTGTIYYTADGSVPTTASTVYVAPFQISVTSGMTVRAIRTMPGYSTSNVAAAVYSVAYQQAPTPEISPAGGSFTGATTATITCSLAGSTIYYTTDGSAPTASSTLFSTPISVGYSMVIQAICTKAAYLDSATATANFVLSGIGIAVPPTMNPASGLFATAQTVTLSCSSNGSIGYYTYDGSTPTTSSYSVTTNGQPVVSATGTLKAICGGGGYISSVVASNNYIISSTEVAPVITPATQTFTGTLSVTMTCAPDYIATPHYTTNGSTPTSASPAYSTPIQVSATTTVKALCVRAGFTDSSVTSVTYTQQVSADPIFSLTPGNQGSCEAIEPDVYIVCPPATFQNPSLPTGFLYFTTDGTDPTVPETGTTLKASYTVSANVVTPSRQSITFKGICAQAGKAISSIASAAYSCTASQLTGTPTFNPAAGTYSATQSVTVAASTHSQTNFQPVRILCTRDGTTPAYHYTGSTFYADGVSFVAAEGVYPSGTVTVDSTQTLRCMTIHPWFTDSTVTSAAYTISSTPVAPTITSGYPKTAYADNTSSATIATSSFTLAANTICLAVVGSGCGTETISGVASTGQTWTEVLSKTNGGGVTAVYSTTTGASPTASAVTATLASANVRSISVYCFDNANTSLGNTASAYKSYSGYLHVSITPTYSNSLLIAGMNNCAGTTDWTWLSGTTSDYDHRDTVYNNRFGTMYSANPVTAATPYDIGSSAPASQDGNIIAVEVRSSSGDAAPGIPTGLQVAAISSSSLQATWSTTTGALSYYIQQAPDSGGSPGTWGTAVNLGSTSYVATGLSAGTPYWYHVAATNSYGTSAYSAAVSGTTSGAATTAETPTFSPLPATYMAAQTVTLTCSSPTPTIRYTTDGSTPTGSSTVYSTPLSVTASTTLKAICQSAGLSDSAVAVGVYTISSGSELFNNGTFIVAVQSPDVANFSAWASRGVNAIIGGAPGNGSTPTASAYYAAIRSFNTAQGSTVFHIIPQPEQSMPIGADVWAMEQTVANGNDEPNNGAASALLSYYTELNDQYTAWKAQQNVPVLLNFGGTDMIVHWRNGYGSNYTNIIATAADWVAFDDYPFADYNAWLNINGASQLGWSSIIGYGLDVLRTLTAKPTMAYIQVGTTSTGDNTVYPIDVRNEWWNAIIHGAQGILIWIANGSDSFNENLPSANGTEITANAAWSSMFSTVLASSVITPTTTGPVDGIGIPTIHIGGRATSAGNYYFVQNISKTANWTGALTLPGAGTVANATVYSMPTSWPTTTTPVTSSVTISASVLPTRTLVSGEVIVVKAF